MHYPRQRFADHPILEGRRIVQVAAGLQMHQYPSFSMSLDKTVRLVL